MQAMEKEARAASVPKGAASKVQCRAADSFSFLPPSHHRHSQSTTLQATENVRAAGAAQAAVQALKVRLWVFIKAAACK
jgi:hypothetical protein